MVFIKIIALRDVYFGLTNGDVYEGDWKDDKRHGNGKYTFFANGDIQEGKWDNDKFIGKE